MTSSGLAIFGSDPKWPHAIAIAKPAPAVDYIASVGEANARLIAEAPAMLTALELAEDFIAGFEDDELQEGIKWLLATIRAPLARINTQEK
jgi:hypothetical protein